MPTDDKSAVDVELGSHPVGVPTTLQKSLAKTKSRASLLTNSAIHTRVTVSFNDVNAYVPVLVTPDSNAAKEKAEVQKEKQVLFGVTGCVQPGELLALMGPSGSGKSSLLSIIGGRSTARIDGSITFNNEILKKSTKRKLGFVSQDDLLFAQLTVFETLYFAAMLQLPRHWTYDEKLERAEMVLQGLGLDKCRDTIIGDHMMRGVSGGERKRVSIGHELLTNPSVILLDEPTSGLDSTTALKLMHTLRTLASGGRTIITSIHQPSSRLYQQMDKLLLLSNGCCLYYGDAHVCAHWFGQLGQPVPFGVSTADHLMDLACGDLPGKSKEVSADVLQQLLAAFRERKSGLGPQGIQPSDLGSEAMKAAESNQRDRFLFNLSMEREEHPDLAEGEAEDMLAAYGTTAVTLPPVDEMATTKPQEEEVSEGKESKWGASWPDQVKFLASRSIKTRRFSALSIQRFIESVLVGVLAGLFWWQRGGSGLLSKQAVSDVGGVLFFELLFLAFSALFQAIFNYPSEFLLLVKERQSGMYRLSAYYVARSLSDLPMDCLLPSILTWIIYFMSGLRLSAGAFFANWWTILLCVLLAQSGGLLIGATVSSIKNCLTIATVSMLCLMLVGGFYVRGIPVWISWLKYASFIYWGWNLLLKVEFSGRSMDPSACGPDATSCTVSQSDSFAVDVDEPPTKEACILVAMLIFFRIATYYALNRKTTFKGR